MNLRREGSFAGFGAAHALIDPVLHRQAARTLVSIGSRKGCSPAEIAETLAMIGYADHGNPQETPPDPFSGPERTAPVSPIQKPPERPAAADSGPAIRLCKKGLHPLEGRNRIVRGDRSECRACRNARRRKPAINTTYDIRDIVNDLIDTWHNWNDTAPTWVPELELYAFLQFDKDATYTYLLNNIVPEDRHDYLRWLHHALNLDRKQSNA